MSFIADVNDQGRRTADLTQELYEAVASELSLALQENKRLQQAYDKLIEEYNKVAHHHYSRRDDES